MRKWLKHWAFYSDPELVASAVWVNKAVQKPNRALPEIRASVMSPASLPFSVTGQVHCSLIINTGEAEFYDIATHTG